MPRETRTAEGHVRIDAKHCIKVFTPKLTELLPNEALPIIVKTTNNQPIPDKEPRILFRGRDKLALPMLAVYRQLCEDDGCTQYQLQAIDGIILEFFEFAENNPGTLKQPGITKGK